MKPPSNWPENVVYLTRNIYSKKLTKQDLEAIGHDGTKSSGIIQRPCTLVKIKPITDSSHPANGQFGLFAATKIPPKTHIIDYLGYVHNEEDTDQDSDYDIVLHKLRGIAIDARHQGCEARMVNDYRGIQERPNVRFDDREVNGEMRIAIYSEQQINKGQELCINYGKGFWHSRRT